MNTLIARQVLKTLAYCDQFSYPLTADEIFSRLIWDFSETLPSSSQVKEVLSILTKNAVLSHDNAFYFLPQSFTALKERKKKKQLSEDKWKEARSATRIFQKIPWVTGVGITGALAMDNVVEEDDVDFIIVTKKHSMWLVRLLVTLIAFFYGKRRSWHKEEKDSWCFNLWLEENSLQIPHRSRNIYTAYELLQTKWLYVDCRVVSEYYNQNTWAQKYLPVLFSQVRCQYKKFGSQKRTLYVPILFSLMNYFAYLFQRLYMRRHQTREKVSLHYAFFHPRDTKGLVYKRWIESFSSLLQ